MKRAQVCLWQRRQDVEKKTVTGTQLSSWTELQILNSNDQEDVDDKRAGSGSGCTGEASRTKWWILTEDEWWRPRRIQGSLTEYAVNRSWQGTGLPRKGQWPVRKVRGRLNRPHGGICEGNTGGDAGWHSTLALGSGSPLICGSLSGERKLTEPHLLKFHFKTS